MESKGFGEKRERERQGEKKVENRRIEEERKGGIAVEEVINGNEDCLAKCEWATGAGIWMEKDGRLWMDG